MLTTAHLRELSQEARSRLTAQFEELAGKFERDPGSAWCVGYGPVIRPGDLIVAYPPARKPAVKYAEWLRAIARRNLPPGTWRVIVRGGSSARPGSLNLIL